MLRTLIHLLVALWASALATAASYGFDVSQELFIAGDLHAAWEAKPFEKSDEFLAGIPQPKQKNHLQLFRSDKPRGQMLALTYDTPKAAATAYDELIREVGGVAKSKPVDDLGDQSRCFTDVIPGSDFPKSADIILGSVLFLRGSTVAFIKLSGMKAEEVVVVAKKIDSRMQR
jgi:hypothetical protein